MKDVRFIILVIFIISMLSCKKEDDRIQLAKVHDNILYLEDLNNIIPDDASEKDSINIINNQIDLWVREQVILNRAELNLSETQVEEIKANVEDYKSARLIDKYKEEYIKQELDTTIKESEVEAYYSDYPENFNLSEEIVQLKFYKISNKENLLKDFKRYFYSDGDEREEFITNMIEEEKVIYKDFQNKWIEISTVSNLLPNSISNAETLLKLNTKIQTADSEYQYFVHFQNYKLKGDIMPLNLAKDRIKIILINKRKTNLINDLENKIYKNAVNNGNIKIFID